MSCLCFLSGCYEDEAELTLNSDGSGTLKQKLVLSERLIVAGPDSGPREGAPPATKEKVLEKIGPAIDIKSIKQTELPDGGRAIEFEGTFSSAERFFLSEFCRNTLKLRISSASKGKAAIYCDMGTSGGPDLTQLYGAAKGLYIKRTIHLPAKIEKSNGYSDKDINTVSWVTDLRDKDGLAKTKEFIEGPDKGKGLAIFDASGLNFSLPLKITALPEKAVEEEKIQKESMGLAAKVCWISVKKKTVTGNNGVATMSDLEIGIELSWNEGHCPIRCKKTVLLNVLDDQNNNLVSDKAPSVFQGQIFNSEKKNKKKELTLKAETPSGMAKKLRELSGYVEVITNTVKEKNVLEDIQELAGKEATGNAVLDNLNFRIKSIDGHKLKIEIDGGRDTITSLNVIRKNGSRIRRSGGMGMGNEYTYEFDEEIPKLAKCELEVIVSEETVKAPFSLQETPLP